MELETKDDWNKKVEEDYLKVNGYPLHSIGEEIWDNHSLMRLTLFGYQTFLKADITFYNLKLPPQKSWTGAVSLGLSRIPCPNYFIMKEYGNIQLLLTDKKYAVHYKLLDFNVFDFAKEFYR